MGTTRWARLVVITITHASFECCSLLRPLCHPTACSVAGTPAAGPDQTERLRDRVEGAWVDYMSAAILSASVVVAALLLHAGNAFPVEAMLSLHALYPATELPQQPALLVHLQLVHKSAAY